MNWNIIVFAGASVVFGYEIIKYVFIPYIKAAYGANTQQTTPDWTETDEYYYNRFLDHLEGCKRCDPQDQPCEFGDRILQKWREAKENEA